MLSRLILLAVQLAVAWFAAPEIMRYLPRLGSDLQIFVYAAVFAVLVWLVGLILSQVLRETGMPSSSTLAAALVVALIGAALIQFAAGHCAGPRAPDVPDPNPGLPAYRGGDRLPPQALTSFTMLK